MLKNRFEMIKIAYLELLGRNLDEVEKHEIVSESVLETFAALQDEEEAEVLRP